MSCIAAQKERQNEENYYFPKFLDVFIFATSALEAFINERIVLSLEICKLRLALNDPINSSTVDSDRLLVKKLKPMIRDSLQRKYLKIPEQLWGKTFDITKSPFRDFKLLVDIRNDIIHYHMPFYNERNLEPSWASVLSSKGLFMSEPVIVPPGPNENKRIWIEEICTLKAARWAHNTSCAMIKQFIEMSEGIIRHVSDDYADYFVEL